MAEEKEDKGFRVSDRRRFTGEGNPSEKAEAAAEAPSGQTAPGKEQAAEKPAEEQPSREKQEPRPSELPEINFATFVISLSSSVLIHLGLTPDPLSGEKKQQLPLAKQTIDILAMLQEKTKGNLASEEQQLMDSILYDLRMQYVNESKKKE